jgi:hypothetical protein
MNAGRAAIAAERDVHESTTPDLFNHEAKLKFPSSFPDFSTNRPSAVHPTISGPYSRSENQMNKSDKVSALTGSEIAVVGMAGRFPGAKNLDEFWANLCGGVESISFFNDDELLAGGVDPEMLRQPNFIRAGAVLDEVDYFDASFFGYNPRESEIMDPQQRIFLECAWEALENAGYDSERYPGLIGVYAGSGPPVYLLSIFSKLSF